MSLEQPTNNKMIDAAPAKKGFHFPATLEYAAEYIEAETIEEAQVIYQKIRKAVGGMVQEAEKSTASVDEEIKQ